MIFSPYTGFDGNVTFLSRDIGFLKFFSNCVRILHNVASTSKRRISSVVNAVIIAVPITLL